MLHRATALGLVMAVAGCAMHPVLGPQSSLAASDQRPIPIARGDHLRVLTTDGRRRMVTIVDANEHALIGEHETIPIANLVFVERREFSGNRAAAGVGAAVLIVLVANALSGFAVMLGDAPVGN